jgi:hypothetical protein
MRHVSALEWARREADSQLAAIVEVTMEYLTD